MVSLERTDFNSFYFGKGVAVMKKLNLTVSTLQGCGGLERTDFLDLTVSTLGRCGSLERTDFNTFYFGKLWQS